MVRVEVREKDAAQPCAPGSELRGQVLTRPLNSMELERKRPRHVPAGRPLEGSIESGVDEIVAMIVVVNQIRKDRHEELLVLQPARSRVVEVDEIGLHHANA